MKLDFTVEESPMQHKDDIRLPRPAAANELATELRLTHPLVETESVDVVVSNCVLNLVEPQDKRQLFQEIFRVLRLSQYDNSNLIE